MFGVALVKLKGYGAAMQLTPHFSLEELCHSDTANAEGIDNTPSLQVSKNLTVTAQMLEQVRTLLGHPIQVTSGFRCPTLNARVGGVSNSAHLYGMAADILCPDFGTPLEVCYRIANSGIKFDQLIHEHLAADWTHIAWSDTNRQQLLTIDHNGTREGLS